MKKSMAGKQQKLFCQKLILPVATQNLISGHYVSRYSV